MITEYFFLFIIFFLPFQFALNISDNIDLVTTKIFVPIVFLLWLFRSLAEKRIWIPKKAEVWLIALFLFLSLFSMVVGQDTEKGFRKALYLISIFPVFFAGADILRKGNFRIKALRAILASGMIAAVVALLQFTFQFAVGLNAAVGISKKIAPFFLGRSFGELVTTNPSWLVNISGKTWMRAFGFFPDPHAFSVFASLALFVAIGYAAWEKKPAAKAAAYLSAIVIFSAILFSFSRGAYLGIGAGVLFFSFFILKGSGQLKRVLLVGGIAVILFVTINFQSVAKRIESTFNLKEGSNAERIKNWKEAVDMIREHPFSGVGLGNYTRLVDPTADDRSSIYAHNLLLDIAAETGIFNAIVFLFLVLVSIWRCIASRNMIGLGLASGLVYFLVHGIFDTPIWAPQVLVLLLVMMAMGLHLDNLKIKNQKSK